MKYAFLSFSLLALLFMISSCSKNKDEDGSSSIMVINLITGSPGVDVEANGSKIRDETLLQGQNTEYKGTSSGQGTIKVYQANSTNVILSKDVNLVKGKRYTLFLYGIPSDTKSAIVEDEVVSASSGKAYIRFFNFAINAPAVTAGTGSGGSFTEIFVDRAFETEATAQANDGYTAIAPGRYTGFGVRGPALDVNSSFASYDAGKEYTIVCLATSVGPPPFYVVLTYGLR